MSRGIYSYYPSPRLGGERVGARAARRGRVSHSTEKYRDALVLDRMEPSRPIVDREILRFVLNGTMVPDDFTITKEGFCRLNPQLARKVVAVTSVTLAR